MGSPLDELAHIRMTLYEQHWAEVARAKAALNRLYQPLDYAVMRVSLPQPDRRRGVVRIWRPRVPIAPDAVLCAVEDARQTKDRGS